MNRNIRLFAVLSVVALVGISAVSIIFPGSGRQYEYHEQVHSSQRIAIRDSNGSISTAYRHNLEILENGDFNITVPGLDLWNAVELNKTAHHMYTKASVYREIPGEHEDILNLSFGGSLYRRVKNTNLTKHTRLSHSIVSAGLTFSSERKIESELNSSIINTLNVSSVDIQHEFMFKVDCAAYYAINYVIDIEITVVHRRPLPYRVPPLHIAFIALGVFSIGMLLVEVVESRPSAKS